jgi:hypothetical protein
MTNSNMTSFSRFVNKRASYPFGSFANKRASYPFGSFVNKRASYPFGIISLPHVPVNVTDFSIGSINCNPNNADRGHSIIWVT